MADFFQADVGRDIVAGGGLGTITGYTSGTQVTVEIKTAFDATAFNAGDWVITGTPQTACTPSASSPVGGAITLTLSTPGWRSTDVGKFVEINGGLCKITGYTSSSVVQARIQTELISAVAAQAYAWILLGTVWGGSRGYPRCGTFYQQRLWVAGSPGYPETFWGSAIGVYYDMQLGDFDDEALSYTLGAGEYNAIEHLVDAQGLVALTYGGEYSIRGGSDKPITPTNIQVKKQSKYGCSGVKTASIGDEEYFVQRAGRKIRALAPGQFDSEKYGSPDMSVLAEHVTESGVTDTTYQQEPASRLYAVRADGILASLTADRDQDVFGWARQRTNGAFESVDTCPNATGDAVFVVVNRIINNTSVRYIELFDPDLNTDCALTGHSDAGATVWTGLGHLEGRRVNVKADGIQLADQTVVGGQITLSRIAYDVEIGLNYITTVKTLTPEVGGPTGSAQGAAMSIHAIWVRLRDTIGCSINYQEVSFRSLGVEVLDKPPTPFSGIKEAGNLGWADGEAYAIIQQVKPYPFHLLSVINKMSINDG